MSWRGFLLLLLVAAAMTLAIGVVLKRQAHRQAFAELARLEAERDELDIEYGRMQIEQATWSEANRIEQIAVQKLGMRFPQGEDIVVVRP